jgi:hypothetical protein
MQGAAGGGSSAVGCVEGAIVMVVVEMGRYISVFDWLLILMAAPRVFMTPGRRARSFKAPQSGGGGGG